MGTAMKAAIMKCRLALVLALATGWADAAFDPTAPPRVKADSGSSQDTGLAWVRMNGRHSIAWYGGTTVRLGDQVEGGRVTAIHEDHIVISGAAGRRSVYLFDRTMRNNRGH